MNDPLMSVSELLRTEPPAVDVEHAQEIAFELYGVSGAFTRLSSERDVNFCIRTGAGEAFLFKVTNSKEPIAFTDFQIAALKHLERCAPDLPVPRHIPNRQGEPHAPHVSGGRVRMLSYLEGQMLYDHDISSALRRSVAKTAAQLDLALADFDSAYGGPELLWDIKNAAKLATMVNAIRLPELRNLVEEHIEHFRLRMSPRLADLRSQVVHGDLNPHNILIEPATEAVTGLLDFGDMVRTPLVCDVAVTASYQMDIADPLRTVTEFASVWNAEYPLLEEEIEILPDLIATRLVTVITVASWRAERYPENARYILRNVERARLILSALMSMKPGQMAKALKATLETA